MVVYNSVRGTGFVLIDTIFRLDFEAGLAVCYFLLIHFIIKLLNIVICACLCIVVSNTYYVVYLCFVCLRPVSFVPNDVSLSILDCPFGIH